MSKKELELLRTKLWRGDYGIYDVMDAWVAINDLITAIERIEDILMGDDGQAHKEAEKFLERIK